MASEKEKIFIQHKENAELRNEAKALFNDAMANEDYLLAERYSDYIEGDLAYSFDELPFNAEYTNALKDNYKLENEKEFEGSIQTLIDKDFGNWNFVESNLTLGAGVELFQHLANKTDEEKKNALKRYETFAKVSPWGEGSRDFIQFKGDDAWDFFNPSEWTGQAPDVIKAIATDPFTYLTGGLSALLSRTLVTKGISTQAAPRVATSVAGGIYSGAADVEKQFLEQSMGSDQPFSLSRTGTAMGFGLVAPRVLEPVGAVVGKTVRAITHPGQSIGKATKFMSGTKGKEAATKGASQDIAERLSVHGDDFEMRAGELQVSLSNAFSRVKNYFDVEYLKLKSAPVRPESITGLHNRWLHESEGLPMPTAVKRIIKKLEAGKITPIAAAREMRAAVSVAKFSAMRSKNGYLPSDKNILTEYHNTLTNVIKKATKKATPEGTAKLDAQWSLSEGLKKSKYGKMLINASVDPEASVKLVKSMMKKDFSWNAWNSTLKNINKLEGIIGDTTMSQQILRKIQAAAAPELISNNGKALSSMIKTTSGLKTLKGIFPQQSKAWDNIADISRKLGNFDTSSSVVANMAIARIGAAGVKGMGGGPLLQGGGAAGGLTALNKLIDSKFFRAAMVNAYKTKGARLTTSTRKWMEKQGLSIKEINVIQDTMWGMTATGFATRGEEALSETGNEMFDRLQDIKTGFSY
jgi:hypothetical protein